MSSCDSIITLKKELAKVFSEGFCMLGKIMTSMDSVLDNIAFGSRCSRVSQVSSIVYIRTISLKKMGVFNAIVT